MSKFSIIRKGLEELPDGLEKQMIHHSKQHQRSQVVYYLYVYENFSFSLFLNFSFINLLLLHKTIHLSFIEAIVDKILFVFYI